MTTILKNENYQTTENSTKRAVSPELENILDTSIPVLDHGFIRVVDYMGNDSSIVQAARVSYGKGTKKVSQDKGLIQYLMRHKHSTPFEMCEIKFHIKLPIFVARQWIRHRTANVNEYSARYSILDKEFYIPEQEHLAEQSNSNNQGREENLSDFEARRISKILNDDALQCYEHYQEMLNENPDGTIRDESKPKLARELARMNLTLNYYTQWYWKIDLHNLLHFLKLRAHSHSQYEIQAYAIKMLEIVKSWVPFTYEAFSKYQLNSYNLSQKEIELLKNLIDGKNIDQEESGLSKREWQEFSSIFPKKNKL